MERCGILEQEPEFELSNGLRIAMQFSWGDLILSFSTGQTDFAACIPLEEVPELGKALQDVHTRWVSGEFESVVFKDDPPELEAKLKQLGIPTRRIT